MPAPQASVQGEILTEFYLDSISYGDIPYAKRASQAALSFINQQARTVVLPIENKIHW